jgi:hypothetical protein
MVLPAPLKGLTMKTITLCIAIAAGCAFSTGPATAQQYPMQLAQGVYIGPGGVGVDVEGRRHRRYYGEDNACARLRRACVHKEERGEEGMGNCRRYREMCR